jgi:8-oxo-dGTP pyrophosphatase MutT (NUDIX family)
MLDATWLARLQARAAQAPAQPRVALRVGPHTIGSVLPEVGAQFAGALLQAAPDGWQVQGDMTQALNQLAQQMRDARLGHVAHYWRNEQLGVYDEGGAQQGSVERGAVRPLGIATRAVHLVGRTPSGHIWVQQRALNKANDPGQWDTLMGGMISAHDSLQTALARETQEEAGLDVAALKGLRHRGRVRITRPADDDVPGQPPAPVGLGYVVEAIDWFEATVPDGLVPLNQDGEVVQFECLTPGQLADRLHQDAFTLEAALILAAALQSA